MSLFILKPKSAITFNHKNFHDTQIGTKINEKLSKWTRETRI